VDKKFARGQNTVDRILLTLGLDQERGFWWGHGNTSAIRV